MAEIRLQEGELVENALERFQRSVAKEGIFSVLKRHAFYQTPSQKKRVKSKKARTRLRKQARLDRKFEPPDNKSGGWSLLTADVEHGWPIDLTAKPPKRLGAQTKEPELSEEPTDYVATIFEYVHNGVSIVILVKNAPDKDPKFNKGSPRFGFPGGGVKPGETLIQGALREAHEETGFTLNPISDTDLLLVNPKGNHTQYFYKASINTGSPKRGEEILEIEGQPLEYLTELANMGYLRTSHRKAFEEFLKRRNGGTDNE